MLHLYGMIMIYFCLFWSPKAISLRPGIYLCEILHLIRFILATSDVPDRQKSPKELFSEVARGIGKKIRVCSEGSEVARVDHPIVFSHQTCLSFEWLSLIESWDVEKCESI